MTQILLPELGEGIESAVVSSWLYKEGDTVKEGDDLVELVTDKATFNVSATVSGNLKQILIPEGKDVKIGAPLAVIQ